MVKSVFVVINCSHNISNLTRIAHKSVLTHLKNPAGPTVGLKAAPRPQTALGPPFKKS